MKSKEYVDKPDHYKGDATIIYIELFNLNFARGSIIKYVTRAGIKFKEKEIEDLKKAKWYLEKEIERLEK
jgi:hypothetical protein